MWNQDHNDQRPILHLSSNTAEMLLYYLADRILTVALFAQCCIRLSVACGQMVRCVLPKSCLKKQIGLPDCYPVVLIRTKGQTKYALKHRHVNHVWIGLLVTKLQTNFLDCFYSAMHFSAKRGIVIACRLSVRPSVCLSVCNVGELWSHRLEFFKNNFTIS